MKNSALSIFFLFPLLIFAQNGLKGKYFDGTDFNRLVGERIDAKLDFYYENQAPFPNMNPQEFSVRWEGKIAAPETGVYTFSAVVDDGLRVWVGGVQVIDSWQMNDNVAFEGKVKMKAGKKYPIVVEYFNGLLEAELKLYWKLPSYEPSWWDKLLEEDKGEIIASQYFFPPPPDPPVVPDATPSEVSKTEERKPEPEPVPTPKPDPKPEPEPIKVAAPKPKPQSLDTLSKYIPKNVYFAQSKAVILEKSYAELDRLAEMLTRHKDLTLTISGHTDNVGDPELNMQLSKQRALKVAQYLLEKGIPAERLKAQGYGGTKPLADNATEEGRTRNRRVEFELE